MLAGRSRPPRRPSAGRGGARALTLLVVLLAAWLAPAAAQELLDRVVARVNGTPITLTDVNAAIGLGLVEATGEDPLATATRQLIERLLVLAEATRFPPPEPDDAAVAREAAALRARAGARLDALMQSTGLDDQRVRDLARESLRVQAYLNQRFGSTLQVSDDEVEQYYRGHPEEFTRDGVLVSYEEAEPIARQRASSLRRSSLVAQWLRDLRARAEVTMPLARP